MKANTSRSSNLAVLLPLPCVLVKTQLLRKGGLLNEIPFSRMSEYGSPCLCEPCPVLQYDRPDCCTMAVTEIDPGCSFLTNVIMILACMEKSFDAILISQCQ